MRQRYLKTERRTDIRLAIGIPCCA